MLENMIYYFSTFCLFAIVFFFNIRYLTDHTQIRDYSLDRVQ